MNLGVIRIPDGVRVSGRVMDAKGHRCGEYRWTAPLQGTPDGQPNFVYYTDKEGRFNTDKLMAGEILIYRQRIL